MPYVRFSKDTWFEGVQYISRNSYLVPEEVALEMKNTYPASCDISDAPLESKVKLVEEAEEGAVPEALMEPENKPRPKGRPKKQVSDDDLPTL